MSRPSRLEHMQQAQQAGHVPGLRNGAAGQVRLNMAQIAVENLLLGLAGQPLRFCANAAALGPA